MVPSYGGWIKIQNLPLDRWNEETLRFIGNSCGGYIEASKKTLSRLDLMEATIRVTKNPTGFIPATILLSFAENVQSMVQIDPFFTTKYYVGYLADIHGDIPPENPVF